MGYVEQMLSSSNPVDKRFMNIYMVRMAAKMGIHLGFDNNLIREKRKTFFRLPTGLKISFSSVNSQ